MLSSLPPGHGFSRWLAILLPSVINWPINLFVYLRSKSISRIRSHCTALPGFCSMPRISSPSCRIRELKLSLPHLPAHRLVLDQRLYPRLALPAHTLAQRRVMRLSGLLSTQITSASIPCGGFPPFLFLLPAVLGVLGGDAHGAAPAPLRSSTRRGHHLADGLSLDQQRTVDLQLAAALPGMVSGRDRATRRPRRKQQTTTSRGDIAVRARDVASYG